MATEQNTTDMEPERTITRAEWDAKHQDYKLTARQSIDGVPKILTSDERGTCLVPVRIVD